MDSENQLDSSFHDLDGVSPDAEFDVQDSDCLEVRRGQLEISDVLVGQTASSTVTLHNCGADSLIVEVVVPLPFRVVSAPTQVAAGSESVVEIEFAPTQHGEVTAVAVLTGGTARAQVELVANGIGVGVGFCPTAAIEAFNEAGASLADGSIVSFPELARLEAGGSYAENGASVATATWRVEPSADAQIVAAESETWVHFHRPGTFIIRLEVTDSYGRASCEAAMFSLESVAAPDGGLVVSLTYTANGDEDQQGADLDLHLLHPEGWWGSPWDCTATGCNQQRWSDDAAERPTFFMDATHSGQTEQITLQRLEDGLQYSIGVLAGLPSAVTSATATVTVTLGADVVYSGSQLLQHNEFWSVGSVGLVDGFTLDDEVTVGFPE